MSILITLIALGYHSIATLRNAIPSWTIYHAASIVATSDDPRGWSLLPIYPMTADVGPCDSRLVGLVAMIPDRISIRPPSISPSGPYLLVYITGQPDLRRLVSRMYRVQFSVK